MQLNDAAPNKDATVDQVGGQINAVIAQFNTLGQSLYNQRDEKQMIMIRVRPRRPVQLS